MAENKDDLKKPGDENIVGRINNGGNEEGDKTGNAGERDISFVDQQEGTMNNGTVGGNFAEGEKDELNPGKQSE